MQVSRSLSIKVQYVLDQLVPPLVRDSKWFMYLPMRLVFKDATKDLMTFKNRVFTMTPEQFSKLYEQTAHVQELQGETDLNEECTAEILKTIKNKNVLEVGSGRGYLAELLVKKNRVTGTDIVLPAKLLERKSAVRYIRTPIEKLPFKDRSFDYVVTTHTMEHVRHLPTAIAELRRVAKEAVLIVVPKQRPYKYTFSLHTQFFPYKWSLESAFGVFGRKYTIKELGGDWFYLEKI